MAGDPGIWRLGLLLLVITALGRTAETEKDFEFAESFKDDEDFLADEAGSGDIEGSGEFGGPTGLPEKGFVAPLVHESGPVHVTAVKDQPVPALYRATLNVTSLSYTAEIAAAGRDIGTLPVTQQLQLALERLFATLPGTVRIRIVELKPGSLMVTFDIDTDGAQTEQEIKDLLQEVLQSGSLNGYQISPEGFDFKRVRDSYVCPVAVGRIPSMLKTSLTSNDADLMVNNAFPCNGYVLSWNYYRTTAFGTAFIGVFRQTSDAEFMLVAATEVPAAAIGTQSVVLTQPILVQKGDFIGVFYGSTNVNSDVIARTTDADQMIPESELYQTYSVNMRSSSIQKNVPFDIKTFTSQEKSVAYAIQAEMSYINVPEVTPPPRKVCGDNEWTCVSGDCIPSNFRCDQQRDCYDGSDEENCPAPACASGEVQCGDTGICIPTAFVCNGVNDCGNNWDEEQNCVAVQEPDQVEISSYRDSTSADRFLITWSRPFDGGAEVVSYGIRYRQVFVQPSLRNGRYVLQSARSQFMSQQVAGTAESYQLNGLAADSYYEVEIYANNRLGSSQPQSFIFKTARAACAADQFQCVNGGCISSLSYCDGLPDCSDGSDEPPNCNTVTCQEGLLLCRRADGSEVCVEKNIGCAIACRENEFQCFDGKRCISFLSLCDGRRDCDDNSDEINCECASGEFECADGRQCISDSLVCDYKPDCNDKSDESNCPCQAGSFQCLNTDIQECVDLSLVCDGVKDCQDGSDEANCGCPTGQWKCADGRCIPEQMKCDGRAQCEDGSDELNCPVSCREDQFTCADGNCVLGSMHCDGRPQCEDGSDEVGCEVTCGTDEFTCDDGNCVRANMKCDGILQCEDGSDEKGCIVTCGTDEFTCDDGNCVRANMKCDGILQCEDGSDEKGCIVTCGTDEFTCDDGNCVRANMKCDGILQCEDGSDEKGCIVTCGTDEFTCDDGNCVRANMKCDGILQCEDGSDEKGCIVTCRPDQYTCADGNCVEGRMRCDGVPQCEDRSDEAGCRCRTGEFRCADGNCVQGRMRCDGTAQCEDGSDEVGCPQSCPESDFQCKTVGRLECIDQRLKCDGYPDCSDESDEKDCPASCRPGENYCAADRRCLPSWTRCNGRVECSDRSDEAGCACTDDQFRCGDGTCISASRRCDRRDDCRDRSDEMACPCRAGEFQCVNGDCIDERRKCNQQVDCSDGSDERNCPSNQRCQPGYVQCGSGHCLPERRWCDGYPDCPDRSDERNCSLKCADDEMKCEVDNKCIPAEQICNRVYDCSDGRDELANCRQCNTQDEFECESDKSCISLAGRCNGLKECSDGSDEMNCPTRPPISVVVGPKNLRIRAGAEAMFTCFGQGLPRGASLEWSRSNNKLPMQSAVEGNKLMIPVAKPMDSGTYICRVIGVQGQFTDMAKLEVVAIGPEPPIDNRTCGRDEAVCQNGQCIRREYRCDGEKDCDDGSDEPPDCYSNLCEPNEFQCPSGQCVMKIWRCDGEDDCEDGFDETGCAPTPPGSPCDMDEFKCVSGEQCVPLAYQCDAEIDCLDRSDEIGCSPPIITVPPVAEIEVELGSTFTIICEAVGVPTPLIVWRLNWGNIPTGERVKTMSSEGRGQLIISDARYTDAGAYTCEAINNRGSIFAIPDALVIVRLIIPVTKRPDTTSIRTTKVIMIGGTSFVDYNVELNNVLIGFDRVCPTDLQMTIGGNSIYNECPTSKNEIEVTYLAGHAVTFEVARKILLIPRRGDTIPDGVRDMVVVHLGGLPRGIEREEIKVIKGGIDEPGVERRVIQLGGRSRNRYSLEKQIINIGVKYDCKGKLELIEENKKHVLICKENTTDIIIRGGPGGRERTEVILRGQTKPVNRKETELILTGQTKQVTSKETEILLTGKSSGGQDTAEVRENVRVETVETGTPPDFETVALADYSGIIQGQVLEIDKADHVKAWNVEKYIEIGSNYVCDTKLDIKIMGSDIVCQCRENVTHIKYIGKGATDLEILRETIVIEGKSDWSQYQEQDFVVIYMGGIPKHVKQGKGRAVLVTGLTAGKDSTKKENIIEIYGQSQQQNRNQRQIVLIGLSRQCTENLVAVRNHDKSIVGCVETNGDDLIHLSPHGPESGSSAAVEGRQWEYEQLFTIHDATDVVVENDKILVEQRFCSRSISDILSDGKRVIVDCSGYDRNLEIVYVGQGHAELYLNKRILNIADKPWKARNFMNNSVLVYVGDGVKSHFEYQRGVTYFRNIGNVLGGMKSVLKAPYTAGDNGKDKITVIELGFTVTCDGSVEKIVENTRTVVSCKRQVGTMKGSTGSGQSHQQTVTVLGHSPAETNITKTITLTGQSHNVDHVTNEHAVVNTSLEVVTDTANVDLIEFYEAPESKSNQEERQVVLIGKGTDSQVQIETHVSVVTSNSDQEEAVKQDRLDLFGVQEKLDDNLEQDENVDEKTSGIKQSRLDLLGKKESVHSGTKQDTSLDRSFGSEEDIIDRDVKKDTLDLYGRIETTDDGQTGSSEEKLDDNFDQGESSVVKQDRLDLLGKKESVHSETKQDKNKHNTKPHTRNDTLKTDHGLSIDISISVDTTAEENTAMKKDRLDLYGRVEEAVKTQSNIEPERKIDTDVKRDRLDFFGTVERPDDVLSNTEGEETIDTGEDAKAHTEDNDSINIDIQDHHSRVDTVDHAQTTLEVNVTNADVTKDRLDQDRHSRLDTVDHAQTTLEVDVTNADVKKDRLELYGKKEKIEKAQTNTEIQMLPTADIVRAGNGVADKRIALNKAHTEGNKVDRMFLFGNAEYVHLNESQQNIEVGLKSKCESGYDVTVTNGDLEFKCKNEGPSLEVLYVGGQGTEIGINTIARAENVSKSAYSSDKVIFHLGGWKSISNISDNQFQVFNVNSSSVNAQNFSKTISIKEITEVITEDDFVTVIDIGISKPCRDGTLEKYEDEDGEIVYCSRRSDILPEDSHGSNFDGLSGTNPVEDDKSAFKNYDNIGHGLFKASSNGQFAVDIPESSTHTTQPSRRGDVPVDSYESEEDNTVEENTFLQTVVLEVTNTSEKLSDNIDDNSRDKMLSNASVSGQFTQSETVLSVEYSEISQQRPIVSGIHTSREKDKVLNSLNVTLTDTGSKPRRGDVEVDQFDTAFKDTSQDVRTSSFESKANSSSSNSFFETVSKPETNSINISGGSVRRVNIELNKSVELNVGNDCKGKIEAVEMNGAVMIKCTVGGETLELNLVGLGPGNDNERKTFYVLNDDPAAFQNVPQSKNATKFVTDFIGERKRLVQEYAMDPGTFKTLHEVYYASRMRYLNESKSKGYDVRNVVFVDHDKNIHGHTPNSGRGDMLPESEEEYRKYKHEHTDIDDLKIVHGSGDSIPSDGFGQFRNRRHARTAPKIHVRSERNDVQDINKNDPRRAYSFSSSTRRSPEYEVVDGVHDDLTIAGFQSVLKSKDEEKLSGQNNEEKRRLRHTGRLQLKGKGYSRIKSISGKPKLIKLHQRRSKQKKHAHGKVNQAMIDTVHTNSDGKIDSKPFQNDEHVRDDLGMSQHQLPYSHHTERSSNIGLIGRNNFGHVIVVDNSHESGKVHSGQGANGQRTAGIVKPVHETQSQIEVDLSVDGSRGHEGRHSGTDIVTNAGGREANRVAGTTDCSTHDLSSDKITSRRVIGSDGGQDSVRYGITVLKVVGQKGPCSPPFFNLGAVTSDECVRCFCFGQSVQCFSSDLSVSRIALANELQFVRRNAEELIPVDQTYVNFKPSTREYQVLDMTRALPQGKYYWNLPREFLGERLTSYGGEIKYTIYYDIIGRQQSTIGGADVIISGNGRTLYYTANTVPSPGVPTSVSVPLIETRWKRTEGTRRGDTEVSEYADREDIMMVLEDLQYILIRGTYDNSQTVSRIGGLFMSTAVNYDTEYGPAYLVEDCVCPTGYTGRSCQECADGFTRVQTGGGLGECVSCNCNGHSNDCDPFSGACLNCQHNTEGNECQLCQAGFYGDARRGTPNDCQPCPCPLTESPNQFSRTCYMDTDGDVTCGNCPTGYEGRRCERCAEGYNGNPMRPGSRCEKNVVEYYCDIRGSTSPQPNPFTRRCQCKENVQGNLCDSCKQNTFYLTSDYEPGCVRCFCMGVSKTCQSTSWNRAQVGRSFTTDSADFTMTDMMGKDVADQRFRVDTNNRELIYRLNSQSTEPLYWSLPAAYLGDKVTAYGGYLRFTVRYSSRQSANIDASEPLLKLSGNDITLVHRSSQQIQPNRPNPISVQMYEQYWIRQDGQPATREHLLMALADLESIQIRASFEESQGDTGLRDVTLDTAEDRQTRQDRANAVEQCVCPVGYRGLSCEDCDTGFTRSGGGLYLGLCEPCRCNGHSNECDPETGRCNNCQHNTEGENCERCAVGFYGDASRGTRSDCQKCPCPLTDSPNQFSPTCILDRDGQVTCNSCPAGHTGRKCETCIAGYTGNPLKIGDFCRPVSETDCDCDTRGTVANTQCDEDSGQCQCKPYVQGLRCARCREGHFYLEANNSQGCLTCFCSGITNQCTSSGYYREAIRPQIGADGRHNIVLMNRRMNNIISDGFVTDSARNQVTYNRFEGVQRERESLFFQLPAKFRGDQVASYGGYLRFTLEYSAQPSGRQYRDVDLEIISKGQGLRLYHLFNPALQEGKTQTYEILLRESSFSYLNTAPTRETFMTILSDIEGFLIRATYNQQMSSVTLRDVSMDTAVASATALGGAPMVEDCRCPEGYTGLSCQRCAQGYLRVSDGRGGLGRCVRCNCNNHASACDPDSGVCLECQHNTEGDRCERCAPGFYGDATSGTPNDCRQCPCPLTVPSNQFSPTCFLDTDNQVTCDKCPTGYTGRNCERCDSGYTGDPRQTGDSCRRAIDYPRPNVTVSPIRVDEPVGSTVVFQCNVDAQGSPNIVWSRLDSRRLPDRAYISPTYDLRITNLKRDDSGRYACTATNAYGVSRGIVELKVSVGESPIQVRIDRPRIDTDEGQTVRFTCSVVTTSSRDDSLTLKIERVKCALRIRGDNDQWEGKGGNRSKRLYKRLRAFLYSLRMSILSWSKQDGQMPSRAIDQNGVLLIPNVQERDAGNYVCTGSDMYNMDKAVATLIVNVGPEPAPTVRIEPRYQTVDEGSRVRFECIATGDPAPTIKWRRGGNRALNADATVTADGVLTIPRASVNDESDYYCEASNEAGTTEVRTILYVTKIDKPEITVIVRKSAIFVDIGDTARLECYAEDGSGRITLFWSRSNGLPAGSTQENGILTIPNVQPGYSGNYVCTGTDTDTGRISTAVTTLEVKVEPDNEPPTATVEPEKITIPMGTTGTLRCVTTGKPEPKVTWMKSRQDLGSNHQVQGNVLRITQAMMEDRGIYVCRAENVAGADQDWAIVEVERRMKPKIDIYPNATQRVSVGGSALFQCRVMDGDPPPTITWSRVGGGQLGDNVEVMDNGVIMFKQVKQSQQGGYICTATNDMGAITATVTLFVAGPPTITLQPSKVVYALVGQRVTLECTADGEPLPSVYWIQPSQPRRGDVEPDVSFATPESTTGSAVLDLASVDRSDEGYYTCVASNSGGRTEDNVQLLIRESENQGVSIQGPSTVSATEGQDIELICTANQIRNPSIRWSRREGVLPPGHSQRNGVLNLPKFRGEYQGEYVCTTRTSQDVYEASVFIIVTVAPLLTIAPQAVTARAGDTVQLRCSASGSGPFNIEWSKVDSQMNPRATERDGVLEIRQITAADAGRYRCVAENDVGSSQGFAIVTVEVPPTINMGQREYVSQPGRNVELRCDATGSPSPTIRWVKENGELPVQHRVQNGVLTIYNVQPEDQGRYICSATSTAGTSRDYGVLYVREDNINIPNGNVDTQVVNVGDRVSMECIVTGTPLPTITWSRDDGQLPKDAILGDGILIIPQAKIEDAGTYTCLAVNEAGSISSKVVLYVRAQPLIQAPQTTSAALGDSVSLVCDASGYPSPEITWFRKDGDMPDDYTIVDGDLLINRVRPEDAGTYVCHAKNEYGVTDTPVALNVGALVPYFGQNPQSYMAFSPLNDVYLDFDLLLSLKPESTEGMVLYNGQYEDGGGDFVCFGLKEGFPEFRFDVGSGPAVIRGEKKLDLNEWHTIQLTRNRKKGTLVVNEQPAYTGESPGYFTGLDLQENMYLGGVPDYDNIPSVANFKEGFVGSISEVKVKGVDLNLGADALEIVGVDPYNACQNRPCINGGSCASANTKYGFKCMCPQGYTGYRCEEVGERCYDGACGDEGRCYNLEGQTGLGCICPFGKTGAGCRADVLVINPFFNKTSFISYPPPEDALFSLNLYVEFKPRSLSDGIILYEGNSKDGSGDFMALILKDGYLEFRFDTGSGAAVVRSRYPVRANEWIRVKASRKNRDGTLIVNDDEAVTERAWEQQNDWGYYHYYNHKFKRYRRAALRDASRSRGTSTGSTIGLNLKLPLYLGGPDPTYPVAKGVGVARGFVGCVAELQINDRRVDLKNDALEFHNVVDCGERRLCERQPCKNNAVCEDLPGPDYSCLCDTSFTGKNCETEINICLTNSPCRNGAPCSMTNDGYRCDCPLGYSGDMCELEVDLGTSLSFQGDSFIEFSKSLLPHSNTQERQTLSFTITTSKADGLILWQGEPGGRPLRGTDHFAIGLKGGYIEYSYEMGSGPAVILSRQRVDDGARHSIEVERLGRAGTLKVDAQPAVTGDSQGFLQMLNADGNIFIGGVSIPEAMTDSKYSENFVGCIENIVIHGKGPLQPVDAIQGYNVEECSP